jgi:hypothetical protein
MEMEQSITFKQILKEKEFWLLCCLTILMFSVTLIGETFFYRDLYLHYLPQKKLLSQMILTGELPLWNPYLHGGQPFLAEIDFSVLYPSNLLYLILPVYTAFNVDIVGHVIFGVAGAYCLARFNGFSAWSSAVCGVIFAFCGFSLSIINLMNRMLAHPYLPWLCVFWHRLLMEKRAQWFLMSVLFSAFQIFAGAPEWSLITFVLLFIWSVWGTYELQVTKRILLLFLLGVSTGLLSAVQLIPTYEMTSVSSRAVPGTFEIFSQWSVHFKRIPEMFLPNFFGRIDTLSAADYWGTRVEDFGFPYILSIYFGLPAICFALTGMRKTKLHYALAATALLGILFSLGRYFPLTRVLFEIVPSLDRFRYPVKFLCLALVPISYLAAAGFEKQWNSEEWRPKRIVIIVLWSMCALLSTFALLLKNAAFADTFSRTFFEIPSSEVLQSGVIRSVFHSLMIVFLLSLLYTTRLFRSSSWQKIAVFGIVALDLMVAGKNLNPLAPVSFYEQIPDVVSLVRKEMGQGKFYRTPNPSGIVLNAPTNDVVWQYRWNQEVLSEHLGASYGIPMIFHGDIDGLAQKKLNDLTNRVNVLPWASRLPILSSAGVTVIMSHEKLSLPGIEPAYILRNRSNVPFFLYRNRKAKVPVERIPVAPCQDSRNSVRLVQRSVRELEYETSGDCNAILNLSLPFYEGWKVFIDKKADRLLSNDSPFGGVRVPSGTHSVLLRYVPDSVKIGGIISLISLVVLVIFTVRISHAAGKA